MLGVLAIVLLIAASLVAAAAVRLSSLVSTLLVAYLAFVANVGLVTVALSPTRDVTRAGLAVAEAGLLVAALAAWWLRGRPPLPLGGVRPAVARVVADPVTAVFLMFVVAVLAYELLLALAVPPNNWDSLTYHLARAAAWAQHGGIHWIPNAPTDRINEFQRLAEQENLFFFVSTGSAALFALPQYLAELAILVAVYGASRRLGFEPRRAVGAACLLATFSLVALESMTAQTDLVAASFPVVAACLLLGNRDVEAVLAGVAVGLGLAVKLTTLLVLPILVWLAVVRGRRSVALGAGGVAVAVAGVGCWGFVLNLAHTGHLLGHGGGRVESSASPGFPRSLHTMLHVGYRLFDLSVLSNHVIVVLAVAGLVAAVVAGALAMRRGEGRSTVLLRAAEVGIPPAAPLLVLGGAAVFAFLAGQAHLPVHMGGFAGGIGRASDEDYSAFGPVGTAVLLGVPVLTLVAYRARRADARRLALACTLPVFIVLLGLQAAYNPFLSRFLVVPVVLTAPLLGVLFRNRAASAALFAVAAFSVTLTLVHAHTKPFSGAGGRPWQLTQVQAMEYILWSPDTARALIAYDRLAPPRACVGAIVGRDEPSFLLFGPHLRHRVVYLPATGAVEAAYRSGLFFAVVSPSAEPGVAEQFVAAGWRARWLGGYWTLLIAPRAGDGECAPS